MQKYYKPEYVRNADNIASEKFNIPSVILMENAAKNAAEEALAMGGRTFVLFAGKGNNGGDAFAAARHLFNQGAAVTVLKTADEYKNDAAVNLEIIKSMREAGAAIDIRNTFELSDAEIEKIISDAECIIDGLLGTGTRGAARGEIARIIALLQGKPHILSLDIPSGIDAEDGTAYEPCISAEKTATFLAPKSGMAFARGKCGQIITRGIGITPSLVLPHKADLICYDRSDIHAMITELPRDIHKTQRGNVLIFGGSLLYRGAPLLSARGALRTGAGIVWLAVPDFMADAASYALPEAIVLPVKTKEGAICAESAAAILDEYAPKCGAVAAGPGCGRGAEIDSVFKHLWQKCRTPLLLDADMLYFFACHASELDARKDVIITPHSAEAGRILGVSAAEVDAHRARSAAALGERVGAALLKGQNTLIFANDQMNQIFCGSPSLAVPGSGDVLSGVIAALLASGKSAEESAILGALLHASAGENLEMRRGVSGNLAREIADEIPEVLRNA